ncbi:hypothetical protein HDV00_006319 [Rhizophlyctis rosea]|nr:hypothetical protein HDV00_006319 [Rhizophlyctis rosea]
MAIHQVFRACNPPEEVGLQFSKPYLARFPDSQMTAEEHISKGLSSSSKSPWISLSYTPEWIVYYIAKQYQYEQHWRFFMAGGITDDQIHPVKLFSETARNYMRDAGEVLVRRKAIFSVARIHKVDEKLAVVLESVWKKMDGQKSYKWWKEVLRKDRAARDMIDGFIKELRDSLREKEQNSLEEYEDDLPDLSKLSLSDASTPERNPTHTEERLLKTVKTVRARRTVTSSAKQRESKTKKGEQLIDWGE